MLSGLAEGWEATCGLRARFRASRRLFEKSEGSGHDPLIHVCEASHNASVLTLLLQKMGEVWNQSGVIQLPSIRELEVEMLGYHEHACAFRYVQLEVPGQSE